MTAQLRERLDNFGMTVTEIGNVKQANGFLEQTSQLDVLKSERVQRSIGGLIECSHEAGCKTYFVGVDGKNWAVVADSENTIEPFFENIREINALQGSINPEKLPGTCIYVHEFAATSGYAEGLFSRRGSIGDTSKTIYENMGIHKIAYRDNARVRKRMFIDLTAKTYSFAKSPIDAATAVLEGLVIIDGDDSTMNIEKMYRSKWERDSFDPDVSRSQHRNKWAKFFLMTD